MGSKHGRIPARSWVMRTDWSKRAKPAEYLNMKEDGAHSPGPDADVVPWLIKERDVHGFGTESVGTDAGRPSTWIRRTPATTTCTATTATACNA